MAQCPNTRHTAYHAARRWWFSSAVRRGLTSSDNDREPPGSCGTGCPAATGERSPGEPRPGVRSRHTRSSRPGAGVVHPANPVATEAEPERAGVKLLGHARQGAADHVLALGLSGSARWAHWSPCVNRQHWQAYAARRTSRWCSPPTRGSSTTSPISGVSTARLSGVSSPSDRCVRQGW
jgi:hypothetical protein